jgi:hypothetical protein
LILFKVESCVKLIAARPVDEAIRPLPFALMITALTLENVMSEFRFNYVELGFYI